MGWVSGITVFLITWWLVLFAVLPWGAHAPEEPEEGHAASAPAKPNLFKKFSATTGITIVLWIIIYLLIDNGFINFYEMADEMAEKDGLIE